MFDPSKLINDFSIIYPGSEIHTLVESISCATKIPSPSLYLGIGVDTPTDADLLAKWLNYGFVVDTKICKPIHTPPISTPSDMYFGNFLDIDGRIVDGSISNNDDIIFFKNRLRYALRDTIETTRQSVYTTNPVSEVIMTVIKYLTCFINGSVLCNVVYDTINEYISPLTKTYYDVGSLICHVYRMATNGVEFHHPSYHDDIVYYRLQS